MTPPPHLEALKNEALRTTCESWAIRNRWYLSPGIERVGPCPKCGHDPKKGERGSDRFSINTQKNVFNCRRCGIKGEGVISLVMEVRGVEFVPACEIITGRTAEEPVDPARAAQLAREAEQQKKKQVDIAEQKRRQAIRAGRKVWDSTQKVIWQPDYEIFAYFMVRGLDVRPFLARFPDALACLRYAPMLNWAEQRSDGTYEVIAKAPALVAGIQDPDGAFCGAHRTWIDLSQPKGRLILPDGPGGKKRDTKKVLGTQKRGAIRLYTPPNPRRLVGGEGIETTLSVMLYGFEPDTAYWAIVNSGNMGGRALRLESRKIVHDEPDMADDEAFVPPEWCEELFYLDDGDGPASKLKEKLTRGLRRARRLRPGLKGFIVPAPGQGQDFNDAAMAMAAEIGSGRGSDGGSNGAGI